jgi:hypothetical protein
MDINDTELAELRRKAHAFDSEQGRLQKTQSELDAERAKRAELEGRIAVQQAATQGHPTLDSRAAEVFGADGMQVLQSMLAPVSQMAQKLDTISKQFESRDAAEAQARLARAFKEALDTKLSENLPGFTSRIFDGDLSSAWAKFVEARPSIRRAQAEGDVEAVSDVISSFIQQNKELVAGGGFSPAAVSGVSPAIKSDFSDADYQREMKALERQLNNLSLTEADFNKKSAEVYDRWVAAQEKVEKAATAYGLV